MAEVYQSVFERHEKKYMLDQKQFCQIRKELAGHMEPDRYGSYTISNIYYDTDDYGLIRNSLEKPVYKEKLRVRSYGVPGDNDPVFVEIKKKYDGVVYKRRISLPKAVADRCLTEAQEGSREPGGDGGTRAASACGSFAGAVGKNSPDYQIACELDWFIRYYRPHPAVYLAYDRTAYFSRETPGLRITFDTGIRFRQERLDLSSGDEGQRLQEENQVLMEIKIPGTMPLWLAQILGRLRIYPVSYSKYGTCYRECLSGELIRRLRGAEYRFGGQPDGAAEVREEKAADPAADYNLGGMDYA